MAKPRINVHITQSVYRQLETVAKRPGVSKAAIVDAALASFLSGLASGKLESDLCFMRSFVALFRTGWGFYSPMLNVVFWDYRIHRCSFQS